MKKTILALAVASLGTHAMAGGIDYSVGASVGYGVINYEDDDGSTDTESLAFPFRLFGELKLDKINKFQVGWRRFDFDIDATRSGDMGATFEGDQFDAVWLHQVRLGRDFKPWLGVGARTSMVDVKGKHLVDEDGFLTTRFEATSETQLAAILEGYYEWQITRSGWYFDASLTYDIPFGDGFEGIGVNAGMKVEF